MSGLNNVRETIRFLLSANFYVGPMEMRSDEYVASIDSRKEAKEQKKNKAAIFIHFFCLLSFSRKYIIVYFFVINHGKNNFSDNKNFVQR